MEHKKQRLVDKPKHFKDTLTIKLICLLYCVNRIQQNQKMEEGRGLPKSDFNINPEDEYGLDGIEESNRKIEGPRPVDPIKVGGIFDRRANVIAMSVEEGKLLATKVEMIAKLGHYLNSKRYISDINAFFYRENIEMLPTKEADLLVKLNIVVDLIENTEDGGTLEDLSKQMIEFFDREKNSTGENGGNNIFDKIISPYLVDRDDSDNLSDGTVLETEILGENDRYREPEGSGINGHFLNNFENSLKKMSEIVDIIGGRLSSGVINDRPINSDGTFSVSESLHITESNKDILESIKNTCGEFSQCYEELLKADRLQPDSEEDKNPKRVIEAFERMKRLYNLIMNRGELDGDTLFNRCGNVSDINDLFEGQENEVRLLKEDFTILKDFYSELMKEQGSHILFEANDKELLQSNKNKSSGKGTARNLAGAIFDNKMTRYAKDIVTSLVKNEAISTSGDIDADKIPLRDTFGMPSIVKTFNSKNPTAITQEELRATKNAFKRIAGKLNSGLKIDGFVKVVIPFPNINAQNVFSLIETTLGMQSVNNEDNMSKNEINDVMSIFKRANKMWKVDIVVGKDGILIGAASKGKEKGKEKTGLDDISKVSSSHPNVSNAAKNRDERPGVHNAAEREKRAVISPPNASPSERDDCVPDFDEEETPNRSRRISAKPISKGSNSMVERLQKERDAKQKQNEIGL
ncbi:MAG: hypothetical protein LBG48_04115 [Rickettsiales bacterium]|jgi:hypothetical protein|nr:hypothetical protein [Rickettsiales bacterium]